MKSWELRPFIGAGPVQLGSPRTAIHTTLGSKFKSFRKGAEADAYDELGLHIYYDAQNLVELIELFGPCELEFRGTCMLGRRLEDVVAALKQVSCDVEFDGDASYDCFRCGFSLFVPIDVVEGVSVYRRDYSFFEQGSQSELTQPAMKK